MIGKGKTHEDHISLALTTHRRSLRHTGAHAVRTCGTGPAASLTGLPCSGTARHYTTFVTDSTSRRMPLHARQQALCAAFRATFETLSGPIRGAFADLPLALAPNDRSAPATPRTWSGIQTASACPAQGRLRILQHRSRVKIVARQRRPTVKTVVTRGHALPRFTGMPGIPPANAPYAPCA